MAVPGQAETRDTIWLLADPRLLITQASWVFGNGPSKLSKRGDEKKREERIWNMCK